MLPGGPLREYYVFRPERRCDNFDVRVRFDRRRPPAWVRRVAGEDVHSYNSFEGLREPAELVAVDPTGEASQAFSGLRPHYGYGLQWGWPPQRVTNPARLTRRRGWRRTAVCAVITETGAVMAAVVWHAR